MIATDGHRCSKVGKKYQVVDTDESTAAHSRILKLHRSYSRRTFTTRRNRLKPAYHTSYGFMEKLHFHDEERAFYTNFGNHILQLKNSAVGGQKWLHYLCYRTMFLIIKRPQHIFTRSL